jgi:hypothetical protein
MGMSMREMRWRFRPSATEWACLVGGLFLVYWYAWIMDDAYVYFRYVDNLVIHGQGLVWNPGEYVEGFSSPAWALMLSALRFARLNYWVITLAVGLLSFVLFWCVACVVNRGYLEAAGMQQAGSINVPLIYLSFNYGVLCYFTSGLEAPLVSLIAACYAGAVLWPGSLMLQSALGVSPLVRHELLIPFLLFVGYSLVMRRTRPYAALIAFVISIGGYGLFRVWYYADLFPSTFYLKDGTWWSQGLAYLYDTLIAYHTVLFVSVMALLGANLARRRAPGLLARERVTMVLLAFPLLFYTVRIGGDPRHFRYLAFPFILTVLATGGLVERSAVTALAQARSVVLGLALLFALAVLSSYPRQLQQHPLFRTSYGYAHYRFFGINDAVVHRYHARRLTPPLADPARWLSHSAAAERYTQAPGSGSGGGSAPTIWRTAGAGRDMIAAESWCQTAYLHPAVPVIHSLGLTDAFLARTRMPADRPAHKTGLLPLAEDLMAIRAVHGFRPGTFDAAVALGSAPDWIEHNVTPLRAIEARVYNRHDLITNIKLAFSRAPWIIP